MRVSEYTTNDPSKVVLTDAGNFDTVAVENHVNLPSAHEPRLSMARGRWYSWGSVAHDTCGWGAC